MALATLVACGGAGGGPAAGTISGTVLAGPQCPVVREGSECPDKPVAAADITVVAFGSTRAVATARADDDGRFEVSVPGGRYLVAAESGNLACSPASVTVTAGDTSEVTVQCDTGIR